MTKQPAVYILASKRNGTLYVGVTSDLRKRAWTHKNDLIEGFTRKYGVHLLVYYELYEDMVSAITREKQIKKWNRAWKLELIEEQNPDWGSVGWNHLKIYDQRHWIPASAGMT
jgi:putative endonuclease